jgi:hypothetical protein
METRRLKIEPWMAYRPVVAASLHFEEELVRIRIKVKSWIWIRIRGKSWMRIRFRLLELVLLSKMCLKTVDIIDIKIDNGEFFCDTVCNLRKSLKTKID